MVESYKYDFDSMRQQLDNAEEKGYINGYDDCERQRPINITWLIFIGMAIGYLIGINT